jgi:hypothetical protein
MEAAMASECPTGTNASAAPWYKNKGLPMPAEAYNPALFTFF